MESYFLLVFQRQTRSYNGEREGEREREEREREREIEIHRKLHRITKKSHIVSHGHYEVVWPFVSLVAIMTGHLTTLAGTCIETKGERVKG